MNSPPSARMLSTCSINGVCVDVSLNGLAFAVVDSAMPISEIGLSLLVHQEVDVSVCREFVRIETIDSGSTYSRTIPCRISIFTSLVTRARARPFRSVSVPLHDSNNRYLLFVALPLYGVGSSSRLISSDIICGFV